MKLGRSHATTAKKRTKKRDARAALLFCCYKPIAFFQFSLPSPASLLRLPIQQCKYPADWKKGQVTPLPKGGDAMRKKAYGPVSVSPAMNNIYKRIFESQLLSHVQSESVDKPVGQVTFTL